ncbi:MAG: hypothetical protein R3C18_27205 [Planctomycetaceae bacterium]
MESFLCEELRIVDDELFFAVQRRLAELKQAPRGPKKDKDPHLWDLVVEFFCCARCEERFHQTGAGNKGMHCKNGDLCPCNSAERRDLAAKRRLDPIVAAAIANIGLLLACLLPLVLCWYLLTRRVEPADDQAVAEVLLEDLVADRPLLLLRTDGVRAIGLRAERDVSRSPDDSDHADRST